MDIALLILAPWILANLLAVASLVLLGSRYRGSRLVIVLALGAGGSGVVLSLSQASLAGGLHLIHLLSWFPVVASGLAILGWWRASRGGCKPNEGGLCSTHSPTYRGRETSSPPGELRAD